MFLYGDSISGTLVEQRTFVRGTELEAVTGGCAAGFGVVALKVDFGTFF